jgi:hypothetical protein
LVLDPASMQGELDCKRKLPAVGSMNKGALVMLAGPLPGSGIVQQWLWAAGPARKPEPAILQGF